jgi:histone-lysine N-methyltransferase SETMAR
MVTIFLNGTGDWVINVLPKGVDLDGDYFADQILTPLAEFCYKGRRVPGHRKIRVHFDNAPIHKTKTVIDKIAELQLSRIEHPPYSPDLAPYDFFLFGYIKEILKDQSFETQDELLEAIEAIVREIGRDLLQSTFRSWARRLEECFRRGGDYVE